MKRRTPVWIQDLGIATASLLWAVWLTAPLIFRMADGLPKELGDPLLNAWILAWETRSLSEQPGTFFDAPIFYPHRGTLAYSEPLLGILPFALPFILATGIPALGYNIAFLASFWIAALGMYQLTRAIGGRRRAAFVAGLLFAALPYRFAHLIHLQLLYVGWIPLAMAALIRYVRRPGWRRAADVLLAVLLMALSTWHLAIFGGIALIVLLVWMAWEGRISPQAWPGLGGIAFACALGIVPIAWPYFQIAPELARVRTIALAREFAAWPMDALAAAPDLRLLGPLTAPFRIPGHSTHEVQLYVGLGVLSAAFLGLRASRGAFLRQTALVLIGVGGVMALGPSWTIGSWEIPGPYALAVAMIPGITLIRATARWFILVLIGLSALAGLGLDRILHARRWPLALLWIGLGIIEGWAVPLPIAPLPRLSELPEVYRWLARQPGDFAVLELPVFLPLDDAEVRRMYAGLLHRKPLVIAYSGYIPPDVRQIRERLRAFPQPEALAEIVRLAERRVRYVLVDRSKILDFYMNGLCKVSRDPHFEHVEYMEPYDIFEIHRDPVATQLPPLRAVEARFGDVAILRGYDTRWLAPDRLEVWLLWEAGPQPQGSYAITVQALDERGEKHAQRDGVPRNQGYPFYCWRPGEQILDHRILEASADELARAVQLGIAIYEWPSLVRLEVSSDQPVADRMVRLPLR